MNSRYNKLLQLSSQKNKRAFKELYEQTSPFVYGVTMHALKRKTLAEEVLQEIYLEVWLSCASFNPDKGSVKTWLLGITKNKVAEKLRATRKCVKQY